VESVNKARRAARWNCPHLGCLKDRWPTDLCLDGGRRRKHHGRSEPPADLKRQNIEMRLQHLPCKWYKALPTRASPGRDDSLRMVGSITRWIAYARAEGPRVTQIERFNGRH
jgi:hypothetical protein